MPMYRIRTVDKPAVISMTKATDAEMSTGVSIPENEAAALFYILGDHLYNETWMEFMRLIEEYKKIQSNTVEFKSQEMDDFWNRLERKAKQYEV